MSQEKLLSNFGKHICQFLTGLTGLKNSAIKTGNKTCNEIM